MKKGFSLIETIVYITLLSFILIGIISSLFSYLHQSIYKPVITDADNDLLIQNFHEKN
jgi:hypothetical protein